MAVSEKIVIATKSGAGNGLLLLAVAIYLGVVMYQGNLAPFLNTLWKDISGKGPTGYAFWQWGVAIFVLVYLSSFPSLQGPMDVLIVILFVALLIQLATKQPQLFGNLNSAIAKVFGT